MIELTRQARRRWRRINKENAGHCLCGKPSTVVLSYGPAQFGRCDEHADYPLTAVWYGQPDGTFLPGP